MMSTVRRAVRYSALTLGLLCASHAQAAEDWWFDIEVILFDRNVSLTELQEQFPEQEILSAPETDWDLLSGLLYPDIRYIYQSLPVCGQEAGAFYLPPMTLDEVIEAHRAWQAAQPVSVSVEDSTALSGPESYGELVSDGNTEDSFAEEPYIVIDEPAQADSAIDVEPVFPYWTEQEIAAAWLTAINWQQALTPIKVPRKVETCRTEKPWFDYQNGQLIANYPDYRQPMASEVPLFPQGVDWPRSSTPHILSQSANNLTKLSGNLRWRKGINRLLHMSWRQPVKFGENRAEKLRLFAGKNYADAFTLTGEAVLPDYNTQQPSTTLDASDDFFTKLNQALVDPKAVSFASMIAPVQEKASPLIPAADDKTPIWQIDGFVQIYLKYINRTPYLHVNSELQYRQPVPVEGSDATKPTYRLASVPFKQVRRVISKQVHYFDHPLFGMVVEINRYHRPAE